MSKDLPPMQADQFGGFDRPAQPKPLPVGPYEPRGECNPTFEPTPRYRHADK